LLNALPPRLILRRLTAYALGQANSASWNRFPRTIFPFICRHLLHIYRRFPQLALHFRDSYEANCNPEGMVAVFPVLNIILFWFIALEPSPTDKKSTNAGN